MDVWVAFAVLLALLVAFGLSGSIAIVFFFAGMASAWDADVIRFLGFIALVSFLVQRFKR